MTSQVVSMTGIWMQRMATVWLVLSLTDSPFLSSANDFASQIPILVLGLFSGALVDRVDKKHLIQVFEKYQKELPELEFMPEIANSRGNRWLTTALLKEKGTHLRVIEALTKENIESRLY